MKKRGYLLAIVGLSLVCIGLGVALYLNNSAMSGHASSLENVYQKSLYELIDDVNSMEVEVSKMLISSDFASQKKSLSTIKQQSADAQNSLSYLPINNSLVFEASKFINQLNGYCTSILNGGGVALDETQQKTWEEIYDCIASLKYELNKVSAKVSQGYSILDNLDSDKEIDSFSKNFNITSDSIEYPSMIYDGPFSDALYNREIKGLSSDTCTNEQAKEYLNEVFEDFGVKSITYQNKTKGKFTTFNFMVKTNLASYYAQVTEQGKFLLNISGAINVGKENISQEKAITMAEDFAKKLSLENMKCVWKATSGNITYVNLAPVKEGIIYYPDLIKVKVDLNAAAICGWEASNYAYNHTDRKENAFSKTESEILAATSSKISVVSLKKCLIPQEYGGEVFAYEICGKYNNFTYYLYFDSVTGNQIKVMRVVQTSDGELLL